MAQTVNTIGTLTAENRVFYERALLKRLLPTLHAYNDAQKSILPKNSGTTVNFRKFSSLAIPTSALTEGTTPNGKNLAVTAITAEAKQYGDYVVISDLLAKTGIDKALTEGSLLCGEQAALLIDSVILDAMYKTTNVVFAGDKATGTITAADTLKEADIMKVVLKLKNKNARRFEDGYYHAIITPAQAYSLMGETGWIDAAKYGSIKKLLKGEVGELHGVRFMESTNAKTILKTDSGAHGAASAKIDTSDAIIYGADSYGVVDMESGAGKPDIITKDFGSSGTDDPLNQRASVGWKNLFTATVLDNDAIIKVTSAIAAV
ncbi:MAG: N4-gp56 family major capsid protein [Christensenellales bacterium]|jgi:N4-gp56 family major capsid protein|nr:MAG TPA: major capsid protein [Caudoviricetes sp.]